MTTVPYETRTARVIAGVNANGDVFTRGALDQAARDLVGKNVALGEETVGEVLDTRVVDGAVEALVRVKRNPFLAVGYSIA